MCYSGNLIIESRISSGLPFVVAFTKSYFPSASRNDQELIVSVSSKKVILDEEK